MIYVGIDPGLDGAIACINGNEAFFKKMPIAMLTIRGCKKRSVDKLGVKNIINEFLDYAKGCNDQMFVVAEETHAFPNQSSKSNFTSGRNLGFLEGYCIGANIAFATVSPKTWQSEFFKTTKPGQTKILSCQNAGQLYPTISLETPRGRKCDGIADALLIATYGKRKNL